MKISASRWEKKKKKSYLQDAPVKLKDTRRTSDVRGGWETWLKIGVGGYKRSEIEKLVYRTTRVWVEISDPDPDPAWVRVEVSEPGPNPDPALGPQWGPSKTQLCIKTNSWRS